MCSKLLPNQNFDSMPSKHLNTKELCKNFYSQTQEHKFFEIKKVVALKKQLQESMKLQLQNGLNLSKFRCQQSASGYTVEVFKLEQKNLKQKRNFMFFGSKSWVLLENNLS